MKNQIKTIELTINEIESLKLLVENELKSNCDYILEIKGKEKDCWEEHQKEIKSILKKFKGGEKKWKHIKKYKKKN